jgi:Tfp pilus assembly protein PilF
MSLDIAKASFAAGVEQLRQGDRSVAIETFSHVLKLDPNRADAYGHRCIARYQTGDTLGALADCHCAATLYLEQGNFPQHQYARKMLAKLQALSASKP